MIDKHDTISLFGNNSLRASCFTDYIWSLVEKEIIFLIGVTNITTISIYVDNDSTIITATSDNDLLLTKRLNFYYNHVLTQMSELCISLTVRFISSNLKISNITPKPYLVKLKTTKHNPNDNTLVFKRFYIHISAFFWDRWMT